jgi:hypothetical protein
MFGVVSVAGAGSGAAGGAGLVGAGSPGGVAFVRSLFNKSGGSFGAEALRALGPKFTGICLLFLIPSRLPSADWPAAWSSGGVGFDFFVFGICLLHLSFKV